MKEEKDIEEKKNVVKFFLLLLTCDVVFVPRSSSDLG